MKRKPLYLVKWALPTLLLDRLYILQTFIDLVLATINSENDFVLISTQDSRKKAGGSFAFNRIQRANIKALDRQLEFTDVENKIFLIDRHSQSSLKIKIVFSSQFTKSYPVVN